MKSDLLPDYENPVDANRDNVFEVNVVISDPTGSGSSSSLPVTVTVIDSDEPPVITGPDEISFLEGSTSDVAVYSAADPEGATTTLSLGGTDAASFTLTDGTLRFKTAPKRETKSSYSVTITARDGPETQSQSPTDEPTAKSSSLDVTITVQAALTISGTSSPMYAENGTAAVASYTTDAAAGATVTWSLPGGADKDKFSISSEGALSFNSPPDFEAPSDADTNNTYLVTVRATDGEKVGIVDVTVTVTNANDPPHYYMIEGFRATSKDLGEGYGGYLLSFRAIDREGDTITPSVSGPDSDKFTFTYGGWQDIYDLHMKSGIYPDYENPVDANQDNVFEVNVVISNTLSRLASTGFS